MNKRVTFAAIACGVLLAANSAIAAPIVIDNGDAGWVGTGLTPQAIGDAYGGDYAWNSTGGDHNANATYTFSGLAAGTYDVYASWRLNGQGNTGGIDLSMTDGGPASTHGQTVGPAADLVINDGIQDINFASAGQVTVNDGELVVTTRLGAAFGDFMQSDAVAIELAGPAIPEPSTMVLAAIGLLGLVGFARRRRRSRT